MEEMCMKPISEIVGMQEYKNHVFQAAMTEFANTPNEGPAIYYDSFGNNPIIWDKDGKYKDISNTEGVAWFLLTTWSKI